jgi:hypothetical protein
MCDDWRIRGGAFVLFLAGAVLLPTLSQAAISAEVAKKCQILRGKQFPLREPGNPASGSAKGSSKDQIEFFKKCVTNGGNMDSQPQQK